jgi:hypothetical protein
VLAAPALLVNRPGELDTDLAPQEPSNGQESGITDRAGIEDIAFGSGLVIQ